ncbi:MAG TPA: filamentous hemagglutinin N-terminal domain-containing protein [Noviherbaspirillum sp.]|jgi:filamentous hemagglutinin family protein|uniref:filamentous hemagglutinin N-terminal domain-containing protein n=1 Tax=Noviherbaspirillum sp. TaxID=1926288 RepID=UPI002F93CBA0
MNGHGSLNRIFRVVWNASLGVWQVASEIARSKGKTKASRSGPRGLASLTAGTILVLCHAGALADLPSGGQVSAGTGTIGGPSNGKLVIEQSSQKMAIDWQSFSVGAGKTVQFVQPSAEAIALNRVLGGDPSVIRGTINANGRIVLLNPNGILFGPTSKVEVASLLASTLKMSNEDFMAGNFRLEGDSTSAVINQGSIRAADGGFVALVAGKIENVGDISVRGGEVLMGAGRKVRLDLGGPARIEVDEAVIDGYIRNGGLIRAEGGKVVLTIKAAGELASLAINNEGIIEATGLARGDGGIIRLHAEGGTVASSGQLNTSAAEGKGGRIEVTGDRVGMLDGSVTDASGATGGGTVLLGGDYQGGNAAVMNAERSFVGAGATVRANAGETGDGGKVIVWADDRTRFAGTIEARGGAQGGDGGFVEVSGKNTLDFRGAVDTSAAHGSNGTLLLDPTNLTIGKVASSAWISRDGDTFGDFTADTDPNPVHDFSFMRVDVLEAALANNNITVQSVCNAANCAGNITVLDTITWNSGKALTLDATGSIDINADIAATGAAGKTGGSFNAVAGGDINVNANIIADAGAALNGAGLAGGNVTLSTTAGAVRLADDVVISAAGSAAATGSGAIGGAGGKIAIDSTTGIALNGGDLLAKGGVGDGIGAAGQGGSIRLATTTGAISQGNGSRLAAGALLMQSTSGAIDLGAGSNAIARLAAQSDTGSIAFRNRNDAGLEIAEIDGVRGVSTGGAGSITLAARSLQIDADVTSEAGDITLRGDAGQADASYTGVTLNGTRVTTQDGSITIAGRGGDAEGGGQAGVALLDGAVVKAGGTGSVSVTGQGGAATADNGGGNHGVIIEGDGSPDSGTITSEGGLVTVNATGGIGGDHNNALVFKDNGQVGTAAGDHAVVIRTTAGEGQNSVAYASDAAGAVIHTGTGALTLIGDALQVSGGEEGVVPAVTVHSAGALSIQSASASFATPFSLDAFAKDFVFNSTGNGLNDLGGLTVGAAGNTAAINIDKTLDLGNRAISLTGGDITLQKGITAGSLTASASGNISQSGDESSFTLQSATLDSKGDIALRGTDNRTGALTATAAGTLAFDNGGNHLNLGGMLSAATVELKAGSISQTGGMIKADSLGVTTSNGGATLGMGNNVGTLAADIAGGSFSFNNGGSAKALTIGAVGQQTGIDSTGGVTFSGVQDLDVAQGVQAASVTVNAGGRNIDLGTETAGKLSLTDAEIDRIAASSLVLTTSGSVANTASVRAQGLNGMTMIAGQGIVQSNGAELGFSGTDNGSLTLTSTGTAENTGIGGTAGADLVTVGASSLVLASAREIRVDARTRAGGVGSANLDKLHITSTSAGDSFDYRVRSTANLNLSGTGVAPGWHKADPKGTYHINLTNTDALDFRFDGNAPILITGTSNIGAADFMLNSAYGINVANAINGTSGTITLKANAGGNAGNFIGVDIGSAVRTASGNIVIEGRGGSGRNPGDFGSDYGQQYGVNVAGVLSASAGGKISVNGQGGTSSNGSDNDGIAVAGSITGTGGLIALNGSGGSGYWQGVTSNGIAFTGTGHITNATGSVSLAGKAGSGNSSRAIEQQGSGIITAAGLEVVATASGAAILDNDNNIGTLAANVSQGFVFDNGGRNLVIGTVNGRAGISETSSGAISLNDIEALTVAESLQMGSGSLRIAANTINVNNGKSIGNVASGSTRNVDIFLTGRADNGAVSARAINIGSSDAGRLSVTAGLLDNLYGSNLELATSSTIDITGDTDFTRIGNGLTLSSGGAIANTGAHHLNLSAARNDGSVTLRGASVGADGAAIITRGADRISVTSGAQINVAALTDNTQADDPIALRSVALRSTSGGQDLSYRVNGAGLDYSVTGTEGSYAVDASATDAGPVSFSFSGNRSVDVTQHSDLKGGHFVVEATTGNVTVNDGVTITAGSATLVAADHVSFAGSAALTASGGVTLHSGNANGALTTGSGAISAGTNIDIKADTIALGAGGLSAGNRIALNPVTRTRAVQLGGAVDGASLSLTAAELAAIRAGELSIGRNTQNDPLSGAISIAGAVDLSGKIGALSLNSYNSAVNQAVGAAITVDKLGISLNSGNVRLVEANRIGSFSASTDGSVVLNNAAALTVGGISSAGNAIDVTSSGDLTVAGPVRSTASESNGALIKLTSTNGVLAVKGDINASGSSTYSGGARNGADIMLTGQSVEIGTARVETNGSSQSGEGGTGGSAGAILVDATAGNGTVTLDGATLSSVGGYGEGAYGASRSVVFNDAVVLGAMRDTAFGNRTVSISSGAAGVRFNNIVEGGATGGNNLTLDARSGFGTSATYGDVVFAYQAGAGRDIGNVTINAARNVQVNGMNAAGFNQQMGTGTTTVAGTLRATGSAGIAIRSENITNGPFASYTTTGGGNIVMASKGNLVLSNTGAYNATGNIDLTAEGGIRIDGGALTTAGAGIIFRSATTLASDLVIDTTNGGAVATGGAVSFISTLDSDGTARALRIAAGTGNDVSFGGTVGGTSALGAVTIASARNVDVATMKAASYNQLSGTGATRFNGAATLAGDVGFTGNALSVNQALTANKITVNNAGQFTTAAAGDISAANGFTQGGTGASVLAGDIRTTAADADIRFAGPVAVAGTLTLDTAAAGGDIAFSGKIDGNIANDTGTLTLNAGNGEIGFGDKIGADKALGNLVLNSTRDVVLPATVNARSIATDAGGGTTFVEGAAITTSAGQTYRDAVTLTGDAVTASTGNGAIGFLGAVAGPHALAVNTGGATTFGATVTLASLATDAGGSVVFNGGAVTTTGSQRFGEQVQLGADTQFTSTGNEDIRFGGAIDSAAGGNRALTVDTGGTVAFGGAIGAGRGLSTILVENREGALLMNGGTVNTLGSQRYHSGSIVLGGDTVLSSSGAGNITLGGKVDAAICTVASLDVRTQGETILGGAIGTYRPLWSLITDGPSTQGNVVNFAQGKVVTIGEQRYGETVVLSADTSLTSLGQGDIRFGGTVQAAADGVQSLGVDTSGDIVFDGQVGGPGARLASLDTGVSIDGTVRINGGGVSTTGDQVYRQPVALGADTLLAGANGGFGGGVDGGGKDLTLQFSGTTGIDGGKFVNVQDFASVGSGVINVTGTVATSGTQSYGNNVVLGADTVLRSTGAGADGAITLNGTVNGAHQLAVETAGKTTLSGEIGGTSALAGISTDGPGTTAISGNLRTTGGQYFGDKVEIAGNTVLSSTRGGDIVFDGDVDGPGALAVNTAGATRFEGEVGGTAALASLSTDAAGSVAVNGGGVTTIGAQVYGDALTLGADAKFASTGNGQVRFNGSVDGAHRLAVETGGETTFGGAVGGKTALAGVSTDGDGTTTISGGLVRTSGAQEYGDGVTLGAGTTLTSTGAGDIAFRGTLDGTHALSVNTGGNTVFDGAVGGKTALAGLATDGAGGVAINGGGVTTTGAQHYGDAVKLGADAQLSSAQGGNIVFAAAIDGAHRLGVSTGGTTRFNAPVGGKTALAGLHTTGSGGVVLGGGGVNTTGDQRYDNAVTLQANTVLASSKGGDIRFDGTLDGAHDLQVNTAGSTTFNGAVGGKTALASIATDAEGQAVINGGQIRTTGAQSFKDGVTVGAHTVFAGGGAISFDTLDGPWDITVNTGGVTTFGGAVGSVSPVANLTTDRTGTVEIHGPSITATGTLLFDDPVHVMKPTVVKAGKDALFYGDAKSGKELLSVTAGGRIQFGRPVDNFKNYLPTLFSAATQAATAPAPAVQPPAPVSTDLAGGAGNRQQGVGRLQVVNVSPAAPDVGSSSTQDVSESAVNQAVGQIAADDSARSITYVVTVRGGVRTADDQKEEAR